MSSTLQPTQKVLHTVIQVPVPPIGTVEKGSFYFDEPPEFYNSDPSIRYSGFALENFGRAGITSFGQFNI